MRVPAFFAANSRCAVFSRPAPAQLARARRNMRGLTPDVEPRARTVTLSPSEKEDVSWLIFPLIKEALARAGSLARPLSYCCCCSSSLAAALRRRLTRQAPERVPNCQMSQPRLLPNNTTTHTKNRRALYGVRLFSCSQQRMRTCWS